MTLILMTANQLHVSITDNALTNSMVSIVIAHPQDILEIFVKSILMSALRILVRMERSVLTKLMTMFVNVILGTKGRTARLTRTNASLTLVSTMELVWKDPTQHCMLSQIVIFYRRSSAKTFHMKSLMGWFFLQFTRFFVFIFLFF